MSSQSHFSWGEKETQYFYELGPEQILDAVDDLGFRCTGRCLALNSMENRVYEIEVDADPEEVEENPSAAFRIAKFYRPGRWSWDQIMDEHRLLYALSSQDIPVVEPLAQEDGESLHELPEIGIFYCLYPRIGGRNPDELNDDQLLRIGRLLARIHNTAATTDASHRIHINPETYGLASLDYLWDEEVLPTDLEDEYADTVEELCQVAQPLFDATDIQPVHGDCHLGNVIWGPQGPFFVDFDDMVNGPSVQDIWLLTPGRDIEARRQRSLLLRGYEEMRTFDHQSLRLVEALRALRYIHFSAWIAKRWSDPAFPRTFIDYGTAQYWREQLMDLKECLILLKEQNR